MAWRSASIAAVAHRLFLVGGPGRVGKSSLAHRLLLTDGVPWLPTDVLRTVLRRVLPELDELDQGDVPGAVAGDLMYPHVEQALEVCSEEAEQFLVERPEIVAAMVPRFAAALPAVTIRACFLGNSRFSGDDLAGYRGPKPQYVGASRAELAAAAAWIREEGDTYRREYAHHSLPYIDVGDLGFDAAMTEVRRHLLGETLEGGP